MEHCHCHVLFIGVLKSDGECITVIVRIALAHMQVTWANLQVRMHTFVFDRNTFNLAKVHRLYRVHLQKTSSRYKLHVGFDLSRSEHAALSRVIMEFVLLFTLSLIQSFGVSFPRFIISI